MRAVCFWEAIFCLTDDQVKRQLLHGRKLCPPAHPYLHVYPTRHCSRLANSSYPLKILQKMHIFLIISEAKSVDLLEYSLEDRFVQFLSST